MRKDIDPAKKRSLKSKAIRATGAVGLTAALYGAGVGTAAEFFNKAPVDRSVAINAAINEQFAHNDALSEAQSYADGLNKPNSIANPQILNGQIEVKAADGRYVPYIKYPLLMSGSTAKPDKAGKFLEGRWLGYNATGPQGVVAIDVVPFTNDTERFVPYNPSEIIFKNIGMYATMATTDGNSPDRLLVPFDLNGERTVSTPEHTPIFVGQYIGSGK